MDRTAWKIECAHLKASYEKRLEALDEHVKDAHKISIYAQGAADRARALVTRLEAEEVRS
jgi:hypothetical protein